MRGAHVGIAGSGAAAYAQNAFVVEKTANYTLLSSDSGKWFSNRGAAGEVDFSLPAAVAIPANNLVLLYYFTVQAAQILKIIANGTDTIANGGQVTIAGGNLNANVLDRYVGVMNISAGKWTVVLSGAGWNVV